MRVKVRINGGPNQVWAFSGKSFQQLVLVHQPNASDKGVVFIEFDLPDAISPAEMDGGSDIRKLGIMVESFAILQFGQLGVLAKRSKLPVVARNTLVDCATPPLQPAAEAGPISVMGYGEAMPMLLTGWSRSEKAGCWSDGEVACLYVRPKPDLPKDSAFVLICDARPFKPFSIDVRVNGQEAPPIVFKTARNQDFAIALPPGNIDRGYLIELRIAGATAPSQVLESTDMRQLGLYVRSFAFADTVSQFEALKAAGKSPPPTPPQAVAVKPETIAKTAQTPQAVKVRPSQSQPTPPSDVVKPSSAPSEKQFKAVIMDLASDIVHRDVTLTSWYEQELHGRWSNGQSASITISLPTPPAEPVRLLTILRLYGSAKLGMREVDVLIDGVRCGGESIGDDDFHSITLDVTEQLFGKARVKIEFSCSQKFNPYQHGVSEDTRDLGVHVRVAALIPGSVSSAIELLIPGQDLVSEQV